jgi:hypothetical protein
MGRKPNPTCLYCARNYRTEAEIYIQKLLSYLETEYGIDCFGLIYWLNPDDCPECY